MKTCPLCGGREHYAQKCPATYSANDYLSLQTLYIERLRDIKDLQDDLQRYREELARALDLLDECLDLHSDPADSDLHTRIRKFLEPQP